MSVLVNKDTRLVVQGITGSAGSFHTSQCIEYGTYLIIDEGYTGHVCLQPLFEKLRAILVFE